MSYLVDTNIFCELTKSEPDRKVVDWMARNEGALYISTISLGEMRYGVSILPDGKRKTALRNWLQRTAELMKGTTLSFNRSVAYVWADMWAAARAEGKQIPLADGMIAAIAKRHELVVATRNAANFKNVKVKTVNPFEE